MINIARSMIVTKVWKFFDIISICIHCHIRNLIVFQLKKKKNEAKSIQKRSIVRLPWTVKFWMYLSFNYPCFAKWLSKYLRIIGVKRLQFFFCICKCFTLNSLLLIFEMLAWRYFFHYYFFLFFGETNCVWPMFACNGSLTAHSWNRLNLRKSVLCLYKQEASLTINSRKEHRN